MFKIMHQANDLRKEYSLWRFQSSHRIELFYYSKGSFNETYFKCKYKELNIHMFIIVDTQR